MSPVYSYRCPECMVVFVMDASVAGRDQAQHCPRCAFQDRETLCERIPNAPSFAVKGFSAKNGYSK